MSAPRPATLCPAGEDLTALAHGEGTAEERARLLRHVLACPTCREAHAQAQAVLLSLADLGAARATHAPPRAITPAAGRWGWLLAPPAAAAALVGALLLTSAPVPQAEPAASRAAAPASAAPDPASGAAPQPAVGDPTGGGWTRLLAAQERDGRWAHDAALAAVPGDASATGLALLALLRDGDAALRRPGVDTAVAEGTRWLEAQTDGLTEAAGAGLDHLRTAAVVGSALLRAHALRPDARTQAAIERLLPALTDAVPVGSDDHATRPWLAYAFDLAQAGGWRQAHRAQRALAARPPAPAPEGLRAERGPAEAVECTPLGLALEALREEPPVRTLAMALACRPEPAPPR